MPSAKYRKHGVRKSLKVPTRAKNSHRFFSWCACQRATKHQNSDDIMNMKKCAKITLYLFILFVVTSSKCVGGDTYTITLLSPVDSKSPTSGRIKITHPGGRLCRLF